MSRAGQSKVRTLTIVVAAIVGVVTAFFIFDDAQRPADLTTQLSHASAKGYNLLVISVDTLRADHLGCYGDSDARTPNIDSLCEHGIRFERAIAPTPVTLPSHSTLLTGLYPPNHGARANGVFKLDEQHTTMAETLTLFGYQTAAFVSSVVIEARYGLAQGFSTYDDDIESASESRFFVERNAATTNESVFRWLDSRGTANAAPFFAWVHYFDPHIPYAAPSEFAATMQGAHPYDVEIAYTDQQIGLLLQKLQTLGLLDRTLICFTSDHGESLGEHGESTHSIFIYDATVHVPLILSSPKLFDGSFVFDEGVVGLADLYPTLTSMLGAHVPAGVQLDGCDLATQTPDAMRTVYMEAMPPRIEYGWASLHGLTRRDAKYIQAPIEEYYDLSRDPKEVSNRFGAAGSDELAAELKALMAPWESEEEALSRRLSLDPAQLAQLQNLGYLRSISSGEQAGTKDPKAMVKMWERIRSAESLSAANRHPNAIEAIRAVLQEDPQNARAWYAATRIYRQAGKLEAAFQAIEVAVQLSPRPDGYVTLATYHVKNRRLQEAKTACEKALEMDPQHGGVFILEGDVFAMQGKYAEARKCFERALTLDPVRKGKIARQKIAAIDERLKSQQR